MQARLFAFLVWAAVAASVTFWALRLFVTAPAPPPYTVAASDSSPARVDLTRLFGAAPVQSATTVQAPAIASRFQLAGVMAPKAQGGAGIALLAVDGKQPRPYRVGATIDEGLVLQAVTLRTAAIGPAGGAPVATLEVPPLATAATGSLPPAPSFAPPAAGPVPPVAAPPTPVAPVTPGTRPAPVTRPRGGGDSPGQPVAQ